MTRSMELLPFLRTSGLFALTALAEILGCFLPYLWLRKGASPWLLVPAGLSLAVFAWLLTLHPAAAGRTYAAYGGVYVSGAIFWLWLVEGQKPDRWELLGGTVCLVGMALIVLGPRG
jgi:small multidrug resistance family-3 protein